MNECRVLAEKYVLPICTASLYTDLYIIYARRNMFPKVIPERTVFDPPPIEP